MLPADVIAEITTAIGGLHLESNLTAQVLAAVFAPLLRSSNPEIPVPKRRRRKRAGRPRSRGAPWRKQPKRRAPRSTEARDRAQLEGIS